jgi:colanic acid biosynthesis protein WcaH
MLELNDYKKLISLAPIAAIDLIIRDGEQQVLLGERLNAPAKGCLFVPGGRIYKGETIFSTLKRITKCEISLDLRIDAFSLFGVFEHLYDDSFFEDTELSSHYTLSVFEVLVDEDQKEKISYCSQHGKFIFMSEARILASNAVHQYVKNYFIPNPQNGICSR